MYKIVVLDVQCVWGPWSDNGHAVGRENVGVGTGVEHAIRSLLVSSGSSLIDIKTSVSSRVDDLSGEPRNSDKFSSTCLSGLSEHLASRASL